MGKLRYRLLVQQAVSEFTMKCRSVRLCCFQSSTQMLWPCGTVSVNTSRTGVGRGSHALVSDCQAICRDSHSFGVRPCTFRPYCTNGVPYLECSLPPPTGGALLPAWSLETAVNSAPFITSSLCVCVPTVSPAYMPAAHPLRISTLGQLSVRAQQLPGDAP